MLFNARSFVSLFALLAVASASSPPNLTDDHHNFDGDASLAARAPRAPQVGKLKKYETFDHTY